MLLDFLHFLLKANAVRYPDSQDTVLFEILFLRTPNQPTKGGDRMKRLMMIVGLTFLFLTGFVTQSEAAQLCFTGSIDTPFEKIEFTGTLRVQDVGSGVILVNGEIFPKNYSAVIDGFMPYEGTISIVNGKLLLSANSSVRLKFGANDHFSHLHAIVEISMLNLHGVWRGDIVTLDAKNIGNTHEYFTGTSDLAVCP